MVGLGSASVPGLYRLQMVLIRCHERSGESCRISYGIFWLGAIHGSSPYLDWRERTPNQIKHVRRILTNQTTYRSRTLSNRCIELLLMKDLKRPAARWASRCSFCLAMLQLNTADPDRLQVQTSMCVKAPCTSLSRYAGDAAWVI